MGKTLLIHADGGSRGNPGPSGCGFTIEVRGGRVLHRGYEFIGNATNNTAEYMAVIFAARKAMTYNPSGLVFHTDSMLVVKQLNGEWKIKEPRLKRYKDEFELTVKGVPVTIKHIHRELNKQADRLANKAMDSVGAGAVTDNSPGARRIIHWLVTCPCGYRGVVQQSVPTRLFCPGCGTEVIIREESNDSVREVRRAEGQPRSGVLQEPAADRREGHEDERIVPDGSEHIKQGDKGDSEQCEECTGNSKCSNDEHGGVRSNRETEGSGRSDTEDADGVEDGSC